MEEHPKKYSRVWVVILLVVLLAAYPLSIGPAVLVVGANPGNGTLIRVFEFVYAPLRPFKKVLEPWIDLWDWYGMKR